jgi:hypothetical protein
MTDTTETTDPSGQDEGRPQGAAARPRARERGRMRRRLREQRRMREALLMDLGALVFELHRHGRREPKLLQAKAAELSVVDAEVRALSEALDRDIGVVEIVAAGIAGSCQACGMLLSTQASFCASCGAPAKAGLEAAAAAGPALPSYTEPTGGESAGVTEDIVAEETFVEAKHESTQQADLEPAFEPDPELEPDLEPEPEPAFEPDPKLEPVLEAEPEPAFEPDLEHDLEPETEAEPQTELQAEPEPPAEGSAAPQATAPWVQLEEPGSDPSAEPGPGPAPEPIRVKRPMGRLERTLRGKRRG